MRQLEYFLDPIRAQFGFVDMNTTSDVRDIAGRRKIQYTLSEAEAKKKLNEQQHGNDIAGKLETVDRRYAEQFEQGWRDFNERFEEIFEETPWSD